MSPRFRIVLVLLLTLNLLVLADLIAHVRGGRGGEPSVARADIVSGKNYFTTHSEDGKTVYLWYYDYQGTAMDRNAALEFLGQISAGGRLQKP